MLICHSVDLVFIDSIKLDLDVDLSQCRSFIYCLNSAKLDLG